MALEIRVTDPSEISITPERMVLYTEEQDDRRNNNSRHSPGRTPVRIGRDELEAIKTNLLNTNEVTFSTVLDTDLGPPGSPTSPVRGGGGNYGKNLSMAQLKVPGVGGGATTDGGEGDGTRRIRLISELSEADSILSSYHEGDTKKKQPKIPDGGYGWVIVFSSFMISLIMDGVSFSFGLIYTELLDYFGESKSKTAWIGSLFIAVPLLSGPIMSNLVDRYGCRKMTMLGGFIGGMGFVLASFCQSVEQLYFTFGILSGVGLGFGYVTVVVCVAFWFDKKRTFATGIGASGTGIGTFVYAPLCQWLINNFGWRGTTLILAGTLFNMVAMGALMRDPEWMIEESKLESRAQSIQTFSNSSVYLDEIKKLIETGISKEHVLDTLVTNVNTEANQVIPPEDPAMTKKYSSEVALPTFYSEQEQHGGGGGGGGRARAGGNLHASNRSLRHNVLTKEAFKRSGRLAQAKARLASTETLNSYEKLSDDDEDDDQQHHSDGVSLGIHASLKTLSVASLEDGYLSEKRAQELHVKAGGSTWSLDEGALAGSMFVSMPHGGGGGGAGGGGDAASGVASIGDGSRTEKCRSFRGNSLDVVYENEIFNPNVDTNVTLVVPKQTKWLHQRAVAPRGGGLKKQTSLGRQHSMRYSNFYKDMRLHRNSIHYRGALLNTHRYRLKASSCPNIYRNSMTTIAKEQDEPWYGSFIDTLKSIFDFSLFFEFRFGMLAISTLLLFVWYIIPYFYIPEFVLHYKYSEQDGANLISVIGITNTIGMVGLGWLGDRPWVNVAKTYAVCLALCGASIFVMPWLISSYPAMVVLCIIFGFTFASTFSFTPIIMVRLVSLDDFTVAYGLVLLVQGIGSLVGPPIAGFLYDVTNRWDDSFYAAGFFIFLSGICAWLIGSLEPTSDEDGDDGEKESEALSSTVTA